MLLKNKVLPKQKIGPLEPNLRIFNKQYYLCAGKDAAEYINLRLFTQR